MTSQNCIALMFAIMDNNFELFKKQILLCDINETDFKKRTALMYTCINNRPEMFKILLEKGANPHLQNSDGLTALTFAVGADIGILSRLLELNVSTNIMSNNSVSPLMHACSVGNYEATRIMLSHDADIDSINAFGKTAEDYARIFMKHDIVELLQHHRRSQFTELFKLLMK